MATSSFWRKPPPSSRVLFKPPIAVSFYFYIFCVAFLGFFGTVIVRGTIKDGLGGGVFVFVFLFICPVAVMLFTAHRVGVRTEGRNLVISGYFRTTRIDVDEIQDFRLVKLHSQPAALCVIQKTGDVTGLPSGGQVFWGIGRGAVEERAERLRSWRRSVG